MNRKANKMKTTKQALNEYTLKTDKVSKIGVDKFEIIRDGKKYNFEVETIIASGEIQKLHNRLLIKTDLPKLEIEISKEEKEGLQKSLDELNKWFEIHNSKAYKGSRIWISQERKKNSIIKKLN